MNPLVSLQVQEAFALTQSQAATAPKGYATQLKGAGKVYQVYVHRCGYRGRDRAGSGPHKNCRTAGTSLPL
jgi:hypothetical protein